MIHHYLGKYRLQDTPIDCAYVRPRESPSKVSTYLDMMIFYLLLKCYSRRI